MTRFVPLTQERRNDRPTSNANAVERVIEGDGDGI